MAKQLVFVYGSLMKGGGHHHIISEQLFLGRAVSKYHYTMSARFHPFVADIKEHGCSKIHGELYSVNDKVFKAIDKLENHPDYYNRKQVYFNMEGDPYKAWMYFYPKVEGTIVPTGDYKDYEKAMSHAYQEERQRYYDSL